MRALILSLLVVSTGCTAAMASDGQPSGTAGSLGGEASMISRELVAELATAAPAHGDSRPPATTAHGSVKLRFDDDGGLVYSLEIANPGRETFTDAHIHRGRPGSRGPAVVTLFGAATLKERFVEVRGTASREGLTPEVVQELLTAPERFHLTVHSVQSPHAALEGAIR